MKFQSVHFDRIDISIIVINFAAFLLQIWMPEWQSSIMAFVIFSVILGVLFFETYSTYWVNKSLIDIWSKFIFQILIVIVLLFKGWWVFLLNKLQLVMLLVSILWLAIRWFIKYKHLDKKMYILFWIQNLAITFGTISYCISVYNNPSNFGYYSIIYWLLHELVYIVTIYGTFTKKESLPNYMFQWYWMLRCLIHIIVIMKF
jgi:hypothetical protein